MAEVELDWAEATVESGKLRVPLQGEIPSEWGEHLERTVKLLRGGEWGAVELEEDAIAVSDVSAGTEDKLRHYLEGIVDQANAAHAAAQERERSEEQQDSAHDGADAEMTERFRAFADASDERERS